MTTKESISVIQSQVFQILENLNDHQYALGIDAFNGSSVGKHVRHILDFYLCLCKSKDGQYIDYNYRERNPLIEESIAAAKATFQQIAHSLHHLEDDMVLEVKADFSTIEKEVRPIVKSSIGRELMYAFDHAIHHLAIIKIGVRSAFPAIRLDQSIGVAPSTIKYHTKN